MKIPFKDTKVGKLFIEKAPHVLDVIDDYFPPIKLLTALVTKDASIPDTTKGEILFKLQEFEAEYEKMRLEDVANARSREIEITKTTGKKDITVMVLAYWGVFAPVAIVIYLMICGLPKLSPEVSMLVGGLIGMIVGEYKTVYGYFLGSSSGSKLKSEQMDKIMMGNDKE